MSGISGRRKVSGKAEGNNGNQTKKLHIDIIGNKINYNKRKNDSAITIT